MDALSHLSPESLPENIFGPNKQNILNTSSSSARLQVKKSSDVTLFTTEGDKVTLSAFSSLDASAETYSQTGLVNGMMGQRQTAAVSVSQTFSLELSIEGDLNPQEIKDLLKAFKTIEKLSSDFFEGNHHDAVDRANKVTGLSSISSFEAVLQYQKSLSVQQTDTTSAPAQPESETPTKLNPPIPVDIPSPAEATAPQDLEAIPAQGPTQSKSEPEAPMTVLPSPVKASGHEHFATLASKISDILSEIQIQPEKIMKPLDTFLDRLVEKFSGKVQPEVINDFKTIQSEAVLNISRISQPETTTQSPDVPDAELAASEG